MFSWFSKFLFLNVSESDPDYRKLVTSNFILICTLVVLTLFTISNYLYSEFILFFINFSLLAIYILLLITLQNHKRLLIHLTLSVLGVGVLILIFTNLSVPYIPNWALIYCYILMVMYGHKIGAKIAIGYFITVLFILANSIGEAFDTLAFFRFSIVGSSLLFLSYITEMLIHRVLTRLARSQEKLKQLSITDELTQLYNRRHFDALLTQKLHHRGVVSKQLAFAMIDIDYFKRFNDFYGHHMGDTALKQVAGLFRTYVQKKGSYAFRIGGEEFALLFNVKDKGEAVRFLENLADDLAGLKIEHEKSPIANFLTISAGLMVILPENDYSDEQAYKACDALLYQAKELGRDRIVY